MTHSPQSSSRPATGADYRAFIGREYQRPHGCFVLVRQVFEEAYGLGLLAEADQDMNLLSAAERDARLHDYLARYAVEVPIEDAQEGDVIVVRARPYHLGVVIRPGHMLHSYMGGAATVERYTDPQWWPRVQGCHRYQGWV